MSRKKAPKVGLQVGAISTVEVDAAVLRVVKAAFAKNRPQRAFLKLIMDEVAITEEEAIASLVRLHEQLI